VLIFSDGDRCKKSCCLLELTLDFHGIMAILKDFGFWACTNGCYLESIAGSLTKRPESRPRFKNVNRVEDELSRSLMRLLYFYCG
jgi:hypothetical protein